MDYTQFLAMKQEIGLLVVFVLVFLFDTFMPRKAQGQVGGISCLLFGLFTIAGFCPSLLGEKLAFGGMYETSTVIVNIKNILNIGALIVMIQGLRWRDRLSAPPAKRTSIHRPQTVRHSSGCAWHTARREKRSLQSI